MTLFFSSSLHYFVCLYWFSTVKRLKPCYIKIDDSSKKFSPLFRTYLDFPSAHSSYASQLTVSEKENNAE